MLKRKIIIIPAVILTLAFAYEISNTNPIAKTEKNVSLTSSSVKPNSKLSDDELKKIIPQEKLFKGIEDVKKNTPYKIKHPSEEINGLTLDDTTLDVHNYKNAPIHIVNLSYKGNNNEVLFIQQVDATDTNPAAEKATEIVIFKNGTKASIYDPLNGKGAIHVIFTESGKSYDVMGNLGKNRLVKIAESLVE